MDHVKIVGNVQSYQVTEAFAADSPDLPGHTFPKLQIVKSKLTKGFQLNVKNASVIGNYSASDSGRMMYLVQRAAHGEGHLWTQTELVTIEPQTQKVDYKTIGFTYGVPEDTVARSTKIVGFLNPDELIYTTTRNVGDEVLYMLNRYQLSSNTVTPLMELMHVQGQASSFPYLSELALSADKRHILIRDSKQGMAIYDLTTGAAMQDIPDTAQQHSEETFQLSRDSGIALYSAARFESAVWWLDLNSGTVKQPFTAEQGFLDAGMDAGHKLIYYNFTYDRAKEQVISGGKRSFLSSYGVQLLDMKGNPLRRFSVSKDSTDRLEFGGYNEDKKAVILHKFTIAAGSKGAYKKTTGWLLGDLSTGAMTPLTPVAVPDGWDKKDIMFGSVMTDSYSDAPGEQVFVNTMDNTCFTTKWRTKQAVQQQDEDLIMYADEQSKRVFVSSFTRPDLIVAVNNYKKYNWDNHDFVWLNGHWMARHQEQPDGDRIYFFQIN